MPFQIGDLIITVIHRQEFDAFRPSPPIPWMPDRPTEIEELRAVLEHALAQLDVAAGHEIKPPQTLTEAVALEQHLVAVLKEVRELKTQLRDTKRGSVGDQPESYEAGPEEKK
jgi:hypothetical protein